MKNKLKFLCALSAVAATAITLGVASNAHQVHLVKAQNADYSVKWTEVVRKEGANVILKTKLGNEITFKTSNMVESNKMISLGANGTIENLPSKKNEGIGQIKSVSLDYTIDNETTSYDPANGIKLGLEYGYQVGKEIKFIKTVDFGKTLNFIEGNYPSYIRIHNNHTGVVNFNEISLTYGCTAHDGYAAKDFTLTFDHDKEGLYDWSEVGKIEGGGLTIAGNKKLALNNPIVLQKNTRWTLQFKVSSSAANGTILTEGKKGSQAFINLPNAKTDNNSLNTNGFTIRDTNKHFNNLFIKYANNTNDTNTFVMTCDGSNITAYQNGKPMTLNKSKTIGSANNLSVTFNYLFGGFTEKYDYNGTIYHLQYNTKVLPVDDFIQ